MIHYSISFAGAGKVAGALCRGLFHSGSEIIKIVSETWSDGLILADSCKARWSSKPEFADNENVVIVAVPDHRLGEVLSSIKCHEKCLVAHTAGSYGLEVFPSSIKHKGILYPLQTFSEGREIIFNGLPFLLEASDDYSGKILGNIVESLGGTGRFIDTEQRRIVHLAAVFINNFTNYMLTSGNEIAARAGVSLEIFEPLIRETVSKALQNGPEASQTGPAVRNDLNTVKMHLDLLSFSPELQNMYRQLTDSIIKHYKKSS